MAAEVIVRDGKAAVNFVTTHVLDSFREVGDGILASTAAPTGPPHLLLSGREDSMPNLSASQAQHMTPHCLAAMAHGLESSIRHASGAPQRRSAPEPEASPPPTQRSLPVQCPRDGAQPVQRSSRQSDTIPTFSASIQPTATAIPRQAPHYPGVAQEHPAAAPRSHRPDHAEMEEAPAWMPARNATAVRRDPYWPTLLQAEGMWGAEGAGPGELRAPKGVAFDAAGRLLVVDSGNHRVCVFERSGRFRSAFGRHGHADGQLNHPWGVAVDGRTGEVLVSDTRNHRVQRFSAAGQHLLSFGRKGSRPGELLFPHGVAVDADGAVLVADSLNHRVCVFSARGDPLRAFKGSGPTALRYPLGLACGRGTSGEVLVADWGNDRVLVFSSHGAPLRAIAGPGGGPAHLRGPAGLAVDARGTLVVGDYGHARLQTFLPQQGSHVASTATLQLPDGLSVQIAHAAGVAANRDGAVAVTDDCNHCVVVI